VVHHLGVLNIACAEARREDTVVMVHRLYSDVAVRCRPHLVPSFSPRYPLQKCTREDFKKHEKKNMVKVFILSPFSRVFDKVPPLFLGISRAPF